MPKTFSELKRENKTLFAINCHLANSLKEKLIEIQLLNNHIEEQYIKCYNCGISVHRKKIKDHIKKCLDDLEPIKDTVFFTQKQNELFTTNLTD